MVNLETHGTSDIERPVVKRNTQSGRIPIDLRVTCYLAKYD